MKKLYTTFSILLATLLLLFSLPSCVNTVAENSIDDTSYAGKITTALTNEEFVPTVALDSSFKAYAKERYGNFSHYKGSEGYCNGVYFSTVSELPDGSFSIPHSTPMIFNLTDKIRFYNADCLKHRAFYSLFS